MNLTYEIILFRESVASMFLVLILIVHQDSALILSFLVAKSAETLQLIYMSRFITGNWNELKSMSQREDSGAVLTLEREKEKREREREEKRESSGRK